MKLQNGNMDDLEKERDLKMATRLTDAHIYTNNFQKMKVKYATQVFSSQLFLPCAFIWLMEKCVVPQLVQQISWKNWIICSTFSTPAQQKLPIKIRNHIKELRIRKHF
ncbi:hypothetical protein JTB14_001986 [Gonioctena quinquepunctata]|nr:hypothetical protein JTB14_001986 [Gonioctena quinquepunctata]